VGDDHLTIARNDTGLNPSESAIVPDAVSFASIDVRPLR